ncbi:MAG: hypothetical protein NT056_10420 [Proteobacteria bacterium]|nr:hypothetical protein [Pseudomonadota bacterium]
MDLGKIKKSLRRAIFPLAISVWVLSGLAYAGASEREKWGGRYYEPVEVPGEMLAPLLGQKINHLAVFSWQGGEWKPVLSQVDERTPTGQFILTRGPESNGGLSNGLFDPQDLIVFMARDSGEKAPAGKIPEGVDRIVPTELANPVSGRHSWVYPVLFKTEAPNFHLPPVSDLREIEEGFFLKFTTYVYRALVNERGKAKIPTIFINQLQILPEAGGTADNIIDRQKIRGAIRFLGGLIKVPFNESIVSGGVVAYQPGPVRILTHSSMYPVFPLGIKGPKFFLDSIMADTLTLTTTIVAVPFDPGYLIHDMALSFSTDLTPAAKGMRFYDSVNQQGYLIDGRMDENEKKFDTGKEDWRLITGPQGTQIQKTSFDPKFLAKGKSSSTYNDDEGDSHPPENFPGDIGSAADQLVIKGLSSGSYRIETFGCIPYDFYRPEGPNLKLLKEILDIPAYPLVIIVGEKKAGNLGGRPRDVATPQ